VVVRETEAGKVTAGPAPVAVSSVASGGIEDEIRALRKGRTGVRSSERGIPRSAVESGAKPGKCPRCGKAYGAGVKFCTQCGAKLK
jgi:hypothetical protein